jgi:hypothetical protein
MTATTCGLTIGAQATSTMEEHMRATATGPGEPAEPASPPVPARSGRLASCAAAGLPSQATKGAKQ